MKNDSSKPVAPDPKLLAQLQGDENRKTLQYSLDNSRTSTVNPFGSTSWKNNKSFDQAGFDAAMARYNTAPQTVAGAPVWGEVGNSGDRSPQMGWVGGDPSVGTPRGEAPNRADFEGKDNWVNTQTLSPESQGIYDQATGKLSEAVGNISTNADAYNSSVADAVYRRLRRFQDPADAQERSTQQANLADRGFQVGNEAYTTEANRLQDRQSMARADTADRAQITGFDQGQRQLTMQQQIAQMLSGLRNQQVAGVAGLPSTTTTPSIQPFDIAGTTMQQYGDQLDSYNAENASSDQLLGSLIGLGSSALTGGMSGGLGSLLGMMGGGAAGGMTGGGLKSKGLTGFWG